MLEKYEGDYNVLSEHTEDNVVDIRGRAVCELDVIADRHIVENSAVLVLRDLDIGCRIISIVCAVLLPMIHW